nr:phage tail tape measure protein [Thermus hydrothermalis]
MGAGLSVAGAGAALATPLVLATRAAMDFEDAFADVRKVVDAPAPALAALQRELLGLTRVIPMTARELTEIAAAAGQAGIPIAELTRFTQDAARVGVAFGISAGAAGDALAKLRNILGVSQEGVMRVADAINTLSNNLAATAPEILEVVRRVGSTGKLIGLTGQQVAAFSASLLALGTAPEVAATGLNALFQRLATAPAQPKAFQEALARLGLSATALQAALKRDATGAILDFLGRLRAVPDQLAVLSDLFGMEYADDIAKLVGSLDVLRRAFGLVASPAGYAGSVMAEFQNRSATLRNQLILLRNALERIWITLGNALIPVVKPVVERLAALANRAADLLDRFPALRVAVVAVGAGLGGLLVVGGLLVAGLGALGFALANARMGLLALQGALVGASRQARLFGLGLALLRAQVAGMGGPLAAARAGLLALERGAIAAGRGVLLLGRAILLNPIGLMATLLAGLAWAFWRAWQASAQFREGVMGTLGVIRGAFAPVVAELRGVGAALAEAFRPVAGAVRASLAAIPQALDRVLYHVAFGLGFMVGLVELLARRLAPILGEGLAGAVRVVRGAVDVLVGLFTLDLDRARLGALRVWEGIRAVLSVPIRVAGVVVDLAIAALERLWDVASRRFPALAALGEAVGRAWQGLVGLAQAVFGSLRAVVASVVQAISALLRGDLSQALGWAREAWGSLVSLLSAPLRLAGVVWEAVRGSLSQALGWVRSLAAPFAEAGRAIVQGLAEGIRSLALAPVNAVKGIGQSALATLKRLLGIRSPSRVFAQLGAMTALGMAVGLQGMAPAVHRAAQSLISLPQVEVPAPRLPELPALRLGLEGAPALQPPTLAASPAQAPGASAPASPREGRVVQVVRIERIELPSVQDPEGFLEALKRLMLPYLEEA